MSVIFFKILRYYSNNIAQSELQSFRFSEKAGWVISFKKDFDCRYDTKTLVLFTLPVCILHVLMAYKGMNRRNFNTPNLSFFL